MLISKVTSYKTAIILFPITILDINVSIIISHVFCYRIADQNWERSLYHCFFIRNDTLYLFRKMTQCHFEKLFLAFLLWQWRFYLQKRNLNDTLLWKISTKPKYLLWCTTSVWPTYIFFVCSPSMCDGYIKVISAPQATVFCDYFFYAQPN